LADAGHLHARLQHDPELERSRRRQDGAGRTDQHSTAITARLSAFGYRLSAGKARVNSTLSFGEPTADSREPDDRGILKIVVRPRWRQSMTPPMTAPHGAPLAKQTAPDWCRHPSAPT